jgi:hypothetical protein
MCGTGKTLLGIKAPYHIAKLLLEGKQPKEFDAATARLILEGAFVSVDCVSLNREFPSNQKNSPSSRSCFSV